MHANPLGLNGIEFVEFASPRGGELHRLFLEFGFSRTLENTAGKIDYYEQNDIHFLLNRKPSSFGGGFSQSHGPSICSMGWRVRDPARAFILAVERGASPAAMKDYALPAIVGIGGSLIYFVGEGSSESLYSKLGFKTPLRADRVEQKGFLAIDHLTNNVESGTMSQWAEFYKKIFGFTEVRYFDIRGVQTGLQSFALKSPCGKFCIPINEAKEESSQINEYLREYHGPGIQHLAFLTQDIIGSIDSLKGSSVSTLDIDDDYYDEIFDRVPHVTEDHQALQKRKILVDGDDKGYLLQIFTKNLIGPIFIEIIQRKNHYSFGEGNFSALFRSIERDQAKRGVFG